MVRLGKTSGNLIVVVAATNEKLGARQRRVVEQATGASPDAAARALAEADGEARVKSSRSSPAPRRWRRAPASRSTTAT
jgi:N-acetylmuramic acid 6-phosphate (MurNAc-6-P) etherase